MATTFSKLKLKMPEDTYRPLDIESLGIHLDVLQYLPQQKKAEFVTFVVENSIDVNTGTFSSLRVETFFGIALLKFYCKVGFSQRHLEKAPETYDLLESNGVIGAVASMIPEFDYIKEVVQETVNDISKYSTSFAGIMSQMSKNTTDLDKQLTEALEKVKNKEGLELLDEIKNVVGKD